MPFTIRKMTAADGLKVTRLHKDVVRNINSKDYSKEIEYPMGKYQMQAFELQKDLNW